MYFIICFYLIGFGQILASEKATFIKEVQVESQAKKLKIELVANGPISDYLFFTLTKPPRLTIDIPLTDCKIPRIYPLNNPVYPRLRWGSFKGKLRFVIDSNLKQIPPYKIFAQDNKLEILLSLKKPSLPLIAVKAIDFEQISPQKCRLVISSEGKLQYEVSHPKLHTILLQLDNVKMPSYLLRELETKHFPCGIEQILPYSISKNKVGIKIKLKERIPFKIVTTEEHLYLTFTTSGKKVKKAKKEELKPEVSKKIEPKEEKPQEVVKVSLPVKPAFVSPFVQKLPTETQIIFPGRIAVFTGQPVSLDFQDADIKNVFRILAEVSGFNFVVSEGVKGKVTLKLDNVPWDQALDLILQTYSLGIVKRGNVLRILTLEDLKKEQEKLIQTQQALEKKKESEPLITEEIQVNYVKAADLIKQLKDIKTSRGKLTYDEMTNRIIMTDVKPALKKARDLVRSLDIAPRQVMIEARIVEVSTEYTKDLGIQWGQHFSHTMTETSNIIQTRGGAGGGDKFEFEMGDREWKGNIPLIVNLPPEGAYGGLGFTLAHLGKAYTLILDAKLQAMESQGKVKILSVPKVVTMDNQSALISQGLQIPYRTTSEAGTYTQFQEAVLKLEVTPHITPDKKVRLELNLHKDSPGIREEGMDAIPIEKKEVKTTLLVDNEETVVIGGIITETKESKKSTVPFFSRIPIFGLLFQNKMQGTQKRELLMFITPRVVAQKASIQENSFIKNAY